MLLHLLILMLTSHSSSMSFYTLIQLIDYTFEWFDNLYMILYSWNFLFALHLQLWNYTLVLSLKHCYIWIFAKEVNLDAFFILFTNSFLAYKLGTKFICFKRKSSNKFTSNSKTGIWKENLLCYALATDDNYEK